MRTSIGPGWAPKPRGLPLAVLIVLALCFSLASCDGLRSDLFGFRDNRDVPEIFFWPAPDQTVHTQPLKVNISVPMRYRDWTIVYTGDPSVSPEEAQKWTEYDPDSGLLLGSTAELRAMAYLKGTTGLSAVKSAKYLFNIPNIQVYVDPMGDDSASGTEPSAPKRSLQAAIDLAAGLFTGSAPVIVCARQGSYSENPVMRAGVVLRGSYDYNWNPPADQATVDEYFYPTSQILGYDNSETAGGVEAAIPVRTLRFPAGLAAAAEVQHFAIYAPSGGVNSAAVYSEAPSARILNCRLEGGDGANYAAGIWNRAGTLVLDRSFARGRAHSSGGSVSAGAVNIAARFEAIDSSLDSGMSANNALEECGAISLGQAYGPGSLRIAGASAVRAFGSASARASVGLFVQGGGLEVDGSNTIRSGDVSADMNCVSFGIAVQGDADVLIRGSSGAGNSIIAGNALPTTDISRTGVSCGIFLEDTGAGPVTIADSEIRGGLSDDISEGIGISGTAPGMTISHNRIFGGGGGYGGSGIPEDPAGSPAIGIALSPDVVNSGPIIVERNMIWGGTRSAVGEIVGIYAAALNLSYPCIVRNNVIHGGGGGSSVTDAIGFFLGESGSTSEYTYLLFNTIYSGGAGGGGNRRGVFIGSPGQARLDMYGNIVDAEDLPLFISNSASRPRTFRYNLLYSPLIGTNGAFMVGGFAYDPSWLNNNIVSDNTGNNLDDGSSPRVYITSPSYPLDEYSFLAFNFGWDSSATADNLIAAYGYDALNPMPPGVFDGYDLTGTPRTFNYTPGAIERE